VAAVLAHFDDSGGGEFLKAGLQFRGKFHVLNYRERRITSTIYFRNT